MRERVRRSTSSDMGLMQLLTATRSLSEAKYQPHRYKLMRDGWPTFGNAVVERSGDELAGASAERNAMKMDLVEAEGNANAAVKQAYPLGRWTKNPFRSTVIPSQRAGAVQGELSLEKVKPVRNDLSDSDLELLPRTRVAENPFTAATPKAGEEIAQKLGLFSRIKARLFRGKAK
jgi:hypothetical protein